MLLEQLILSLNQIHLNHYRYLLVDPLKPVEDGEPLALINIKAVFPQSSIMPVLRPELSYNTDLCPHLIQLGEPGEVVEKEFLELCLARCHQEHHSYKHYICGWISSEETIETVATKLVDAGLEFGKIVKPNEPFFLPFFEHVRIQLLQEGLQQNYGVFLSHLNFLQQYTYMNLYGELTSLMLPSQRDESLLNNLLLSNVFNYQTEPKLVFNLTKIWLNHTSSRPLHPLLSAAMSVAKARQLGLTHNEDVIAYGLYSLLTAKNITDNIDVMEKITQAINDPGSLNAAFGLLSMDIWHSLGMEIIK